VIARVIIHVRRVGTGFASAVKFLTRPTNPTQPNPTQPKTHVLGFEQWPWIKSLIAATYPVGYIPPVPAATSESTGIADTEGEGKGGGKGEGEGGIGGSHLWPLWVQHLVAATYPSGYVRQTWELPGSTGGVGGTAGTATATAAGSSSTSSISRSKGELAKSEEEEMEGEEEETEGEEEETEGEEEETEGEKEEVAATPESSEDDNVIVYTFPSLGAGAEAGAGAARNGKKQKRGGCAKFKCGKPFCAKYALDANGKDRDM